MQRGHTKKACPPILWGGRVKGGVPRFLEKKGLVIEKRLLAACAPEPRNAIFEAGAGHLKWKREPTIKFRGSEPGSTVGDAPHAGKMRKQERKERNTKDMGVVPQKKTPPHKKGARRVQYGNVKRG